MTDVMSMSEILSETERRIVAVLHEAGEEAVSALINTVIRCAGDEDEILVIVESLLSLHRRLLVGFTESRDEQTLEWIPLCAEEATEKLMELRKHLAWSPNEAHWRWTSTETRLVVLLTKRGIAIAEEVLRKYGWSLTEPM